jgi:hypothetical protein
VPQSEKTMKSPKHGADLYGNQDNTVLDQVAKYQSNNPFVGDTYTLTQGKMKPAQIQKELDKIKFFVASHPDSQLLFTVSIKEVKKP